MNIVKYNGHGYFDYAHYWTRDDINIFIGGRGTGKTYSINKAGIVHAEYNYNLGIFMRAYNKHDYPYCINLLPYANGIILSFITLHDYQEWYSFMCDYINKLINMTEIKTWRAVDGE